MEAFAAGSLPYYLAQVPDPRSRFGRQHPLSAILGLACTAILCGARGYRAIAQWARDHDLSLMHRLGFNRRPPTQWGIRKVLMAIDVAALERCLTQWAEHVLGETQKADDPEPSPVLEGLSLDGKSCRGSFDGLRKAVHLLSVVAQKSGLTLAQSAVPNGGEDKTNEHKASLKLLQGLVLEGRIVTGDAMFCHRDVCAEILERKGDYFLFVKENQPTLLRDIQAVLAPPPEGAFSPSAGAALA